MEDTTAPRFLIVRLSHIGDCVLTLPLAAAIRRIWPAAQIVWATEPAAIPLISRHPAVDTVERIPKGWIRQPGCWLELRARLRQYRFDWVLDPQSLLKSAGLGWLSCCPRRVGFDGAHGRELSRWLNNHMVMATRRHLVDRTLELLGPVIEAIGPASQAPGNTADGSRPWLDSAELTLPVCPVANRMVVDWLESERIGRFVIINSGASWPSKRWCVRRFGEVAARLAKETGIRPVLTWAGHAEYDEAEQIAAASQGAALIAPATTLLQYAALASQAELFIGCDTGPMHIAAASGTRCLVLHGPTLPQESGPWGPGHHTIQKWHQTGRKRRQTANNLAMMAISTGEVVEAAAAMLAVPGTALRQPA